METKIALYEKIKTVVSFFSRHLKFDKFKNTIGRKLAIPLEDIQAAALFKQKNNIATKKAPHEILKPNCSYKTLVVNMNRFASLAAIIVVLLMKISRAYSHMVTDLRRKILRVIFTAFQRCAWNIYGRCQLHLEETGPRFYQEHQRIFIAKPKANMNKLITEFEEWLYGTQMLIELNFRSLKMFYGLVTSLPRSVDGYLANYIYSLLAYQII